jgi:anti-sigma factor RsiW
MIGTAAMSCRQLVELVTAYFEGALTLEDRLRFESHIEHCDGCTTYLEQMRQTIALTGTLREEDIPPEATAELLRVFRDWSAR